MVVSRNTVCVAPPSIRMEGWRGHGLFSSDGSGSLESAAPRTLRHVKRRCRAIRQHATHGT